MIDQLREEWSFILGNRRTRRLLGGGALALYLFIGVINANAEDTDAGQRIENLAEAMPQSSNGAQRQDMFKRYANQQFKSASRIKAALSDTTSALNPTKQVTVEPICVRFPTGLPDLELTIFNPIVEDIQSDDDMHTLRMYSGVVPFANRYNGSLRYLTVSGYSEDGLVVDGKQGSIPGGGIQSEYVHLTRTSELIDQSLLPSKVFQQPVVYLAGVGQSTINTPGMTAYLTQDKADILCPTA
jgi:hypothetical protein